MSLTPVQHLARQEHLASRSPHFWAKTASASLAVLLVCTLAMWMARSRQIASRAITDLHGQMAHGTAAITIPSDAGVLGKEQLHSIRNALGTPVDCWPVVREIRISLPFLRVHVVCYTRFTRGWAREVFLWRLEGCRTTLENYRIEMTPGAPANLSRYR